jgi:hypothetical protein
MTAQMFSSITWPIDADIRSLAPRRKIEGIVEEEAAVSVAFSRAKLIRPPHPGRGDSPIPAAWPVMLHPYGCSRHEYRDAIGHWSAGG